jgi:hypothetical protein
MGSSSFEVRRWHRGKCHCLMHGDLSLVAMLKCLDSEQQQQQHAPPLKVSFFWHREIIKILNNLNYAYSIFEISSCSVSVN